MRLRTLRRVLFLFFLIQEAIIFLRSTPEARAQAPIPPYTPILGVSLLAPLVVNLSVPRWLERLALGLQISGWTIEAAAVAQLARRQSFGIHPTAATEPLQNGLYRFEHPIYLGILISLLGWTLPVPPATIAVFLTYLGFSRAVRAERAHLASLNIRHRGLESGLWPDTERSAGDAK